MKMLYAFVLIVSAFALGCLLAHWKAYGFDLVDLKVWAVCTLCVLAIVGLGSLIQRNGPYRPDGYTRVDIPGGHLYVRKDQRVERHDGFVRITNIPVDTGASLGSAAAAAAASAGSAAACDSGGGAC